MTGLDVLRNALEQQGFGALAAAQVPAGLSLPEGIPFLAARDHWGSRATVGLVSADALDAAALRSRAEAFHALVQAQRQFTGALVVRGGRQVALGSFGVLVAVFEQGAPPALVQEAREAKRMEMRAKVGCVVWCADVPLGKVYKHRGFPLGMTPSAGSLERALKTAMA